MNKKTVSWAVCAKSNTCDYKQRVVKDARLKVKQRHSEQLINQALRSHYYEKNALKINSDGKCRICGNVEEYIDHIVYGCPEN